MSRIVVQEKIKVLRLSLLFIASLQPTLSGDRRTHVRVRRRRRVLVIDEIKSSELPPSAVARLRRRTPLGSGWPEPKPNNAVVIKKIQLGCRIN